MAMIPYPILYFSKMCNFFVFNITEGDEGKEK